MRNLTLGIFAFLLLASQAQAQIGVRTIMDYGGGKKSEVKEGATTMNLKAEDVPETYRGLFAEPETDTKLVEEGTQPPPETGTEQIDCSKKVFRQWKPTRHDTELAQCFWLQQDQEYGKYTRFFGSDGNVAASTEIISDVIYGVRVFVTTAVSSQSDDDEDNDTETADRADETSDDAVSKNLNLLTASGGNLAIGGAYPIYARSLPKAGGKVLWNATGRAASTLQQLGISPEEGGSKSFNLKDLNANFEAATEFQLDLVSAQQKIGLTAYAKIGAIAGTKKFAEALGTDGREFWYHQLGLGVKLADMLNVYLSWNEYSDDNLPNDGAVVTVTLGQ